MLGYIVPDKPELKVKEYELYSGYYCGICKSIGRRYGQLPRMVLNYDAVFLALIVSCFDEKEERVEAERCIAHPLKKRKVVYNQDALDYAADIILFLAYYKLKDDLADEHAVRGAAGVFLLKNSFRKWMKLHEKKGILMEKNLRDLAQLESENCRSMDRAAEPFAKLMEAVCVPEWLEGTTAEEPLKHIGYHMGKWIYFIDAWDDLEDDFARKEYNPLLSRFEFSADRETVSQFRTRIKERVEYNFFSCLGKIAEAWTELDREKNKGLIDNIVYFGLMKKTEAVLKKGNITDAESV